MGMPGSEFIRSSKASGAAQTTVTLQNADDSKLTPPVGSQVAVVAVSMISTAAFSATGLLNIQDGATVILAFQPVATATTFYQEFSNPLRITTSTNDLRLVATFASANCTVTVYYKYIF